MAINNDVVELWLLSINNDNVDDNVDDNDDDNDDADAKGASVATTAGLSAQRSVACNPYDDEDDNDDEERRLCHPDKAKRRGISH